MRALVGSYTAEKQSNGVGITTLELDPVTGSSRVLAEFEAVSPSWLIRHPSRPVVYATSEAERGLVLVLILGEDGALDLVAEHETGGAEPCHLALSDDQRWLFAANYTGGSVAVFRLDDDGQVVARTDLVQHERHGGPGPVADRQETAHVHMAVPHGDLVDVVDLGLDQVLTYRIDGEGRLTLQSTLDVPPGTGPRQLVFLPGMPQAALAGELGPAMGLVRRDEQNRLHLLDIRRSTAAEVDTSTFPAQIVAGRAGLVYLTNRGADVVTTFRVTDTTVEAIHDTPTVNWPRHLCRVGEQLIVSGQGEDVLEILDLDGDGLPQPDGRRVAVGAPTCVLPLID